MADNLEIFGETYPNATGIKAKDTNGVTQTFVKPSGTVNITSSGTTDVSAYANASVAAGAVTAPSTISGTSATVSTGTNTLTLSKTVSVTPNVTTAGYISSGTAGNASVSLTASVNTRNSSSLSASGATVTAPAGYYASDASKSVSTMTLPTSTSASATSGYTSKATVSRSTSDQYINIPTGYNSSGAYYKVNAVANGSATAPASISGSSATVSTGTNTLTLSKTVSVTPSVTAGYVSSGTAGNSSVSLTASVTTQAAQTIHPSTSDQTINSGIYLTGNQTVKAVTLSNLTAGNIKSGVTVKVGDSTDDDCVTSVTGTYSGGGGGGGTSGIYTFDFTKGVTDEESGTLMFALSGATQDSSGLHLTGASNEAFLSGINLNDHVVEVEVGSMTYNVASGHARFIMNGTDSGLIYRSTGYWQVYGYSWSAGTESSTTFFANSTVRIEYSTTGNRVTIYKDNVKCFDNVPFGPGAGTLYGIRFGSSAGATYFDATILKCTLYTNEAYALKILMGS